MKPPDASFSLCADTPFPLFQNVPVLLCVTWQVIVSMFKTSKSLSHSVRLTVVVTNDHQIHSCGETYPTCRGGGTEKEAMALRRVSEQVS